ncbi:tetratricopeptide repeat protein, partial [Candidatus Avelusimicrobium faecicola]|uniref:tetratricopeptide repeat protein n=1 Tax=Candidatus Avelusimicrobium faecicola TaxID=3416205 RepID=UPI003C9B04D8|nr:tetratricopeptide repeat protein [Spirochaetota bacterium]
MELNLKDKGHYKHFKPETTKDYTNSDPQTAKAYYKRGNAKYDANDYAGAMADYNKAIELDPKYAYAYDNRGSAKYL